MFDETVFPFGSMTLNRAPSYSFPDHDKSDMNHPPFTTSIPHHDPQMQDDPSAESFESSPTSTTSPTTPIGPTQQTTGLRHTSFSPTPSPTCEHNPSPPSPPNFGPLQHISSSTSSTNSSSPNRITEPIHPMVTRGKLGITKPIQRLNLHVDTISSVPKNYLLDFKDPTWLNAMTEEYTALITKKTWVLVPIPKEANIINCIWLFKKKCNAYGSLSRYKARLVANGRI